MIGSLLLLFGLRWLHKAILRYAGAVALRDEEAKFVGRRGLGRALPEARGFDWAAAAVSFKATLLEGLEVVFIVLALGAKGSDALVAAAAIGAGVAAAVVIVAGFAVRKPLSRVPENTLKFFVGGMLCSFGMFWAGEGLGVEWPGGDAALPVLLGVDLRPRLGDGRRLRRRRVPA